MIRTSKLLITAVLAVFLCALLSMPEADAARSKSRSKSRSSAAGKKAGPYQVSARAALLIDGDHGNRLYDKSSGIHVYPASTTKVMTAIIVLEHLNLDDYVTVSERAVNVLPSKIEIKPGEKFKVRDLLYAALLNSANDAATALAEAVAGTEQQFVVLMNRRAQLLGARNTEFANCHGLPSDDPQFTTAYDMVLMFREAMKKPFFSEAIQEKYSTIYSQDGRKILLKSHNKALFKGWKENVFGKTGYTRAAQACFVGYVTQKNRRLFIAVFGCSSRWDDMKYILEHYGKIDL